MGAKKTSILQSLPVPWPPVSVTVASLSRCWALPRSTRPRRRRPRAAPCMPEMLDIEPDWPQALHAAFWFHAQQGDWVRSYASLADAWRDYQQAQRIAQQLADVDPADTEWQRDPLVSQERFGDVMVAQGDGAGMLDSSHSNSLKKHYVVAMRNLRRAVR